jgi:serine acetyltransferase
VGDRHPKVNDNVLIGANATILGNITIGKGAQVAAGSLVLKDVPPRTMVAGSPAKEVGKVTGESSRWKSVRVCVLAVVEKTCLMCAMLRSKLSVS